MPDRTLKIIISPDLVPTTADMLFSDCLRIETVSKVTLAPQKETRINLTVHNSSPNGRMAQIIANFDSRKIAVKVPNSTVYIAPEGKTVVYCIIIPLDKDGYSTVTFDVF